MFKKLKDKIAEEVKQSPLKTVQQFAQSVVSPSSSSVFEPSSSNDKFCIEEGDVEETETTATGTKPGGFTSVSLTGQISSPSRDLKHSVPSGQNDMDNFFPVFESQATNFHVQSDWESASEVEDRYSQLEHINKESLYEAYRKVYNRYNKVKNKYHELVSHYRQLEREKEKAKTVLVETQDKALLRISELRDQCQLEQQAKAHLEEALRNELEERDHIINTLKTKVDYLKGLSDSSTAEHLEPEPDLETHTRNLIDFTADSCVSNVPLPTEASFSKDNLECYLEKMKENLKTHLTNLEHLNTQWQELEKDTCNDSDSSSGTINGDHEATEVRRLQSKHNTMCQSQITLIRELIQDVAKLQLISNEFIKKHSVEEGNIGISENISNKEAVFCLNCQNSKTTLIENEAKDECDTLKTRIANLECENQSLNEKLAEESSTAKQLKTDLNYLNQTLDNVKRILSTVRENINDGMLERVDCETSLGLDDDLSRHLCFVTNNLFHSKSELKRLEDLKINLENDLRNLKDSIKMTTQDKQVMEDLMSANTKLQEDYNKLLNESSVSQTGLNSEITDLKKSNNELRNQIENLNHLLEANEKEHNNRRETLELTNVNFNNEKIVLQNSISSLEAELKKLKDEKDSICKIKEDLLFQNSVLNEEKNSLVRDKSTLCDQLSVLENNCKHSREEHSTIMELNNKLRNELSMSKEENNNLMTENKLIHTKLNSLQKEFNDKEGVNKFMWQEVDSLEKKLDDVVKERNDLLSKIEKLQTKHEDSEQDVKESVNQLQETIQALKTELEELKMDKSILSNKMADFMKNYEALKTEYDSTLVINATTREELGIVNDKLENLATEKEALLGKLDEIKEDVQNKEQEIIKTMKTERDLSNEIALLNKDKETFNTENQTLQNIIQTLENKLQNVEKDYATLSSECDSKAKEVVVINEKYNELTKFIDVNNEKISTLNETNTRLETELTSLRQEHVKTVSELSQTKTLVESHQNSCLDLSNKLENLTEAFKTQCKDLEKERAENSKLKLEADSLMEKISQSSLQLKNIVSDKNSILNGLSSKLVKMKKLRNDQKNLLDFVTQFKAEITNELNNVKLKFSNDFVSQVNSIMERNRVNEKQTVETECKNKKDIDSYNSKIKHLQAEHLSSDCSLNSSSSEESLTQLKEEKSMKSNKEKDEIDKLKHEVKLKDDIIKKLQLAIEQFEARGVKNHYSLEESMNPNVIHSINTNCDINDSNDYLHKYQQLEKENRTLLQKLQEMEDSYEFNLKSAVAVHNNELDIKEKRKHMENEMTDFEKKGIIEEMKEQIENLQQDLEERGDAFEKLYEEHQETVKVKNTEMDQLRFNCDREVREQDKKWRACLDRRLLEEERKREAELARLNREWNVERKELVTASRLAVSAVESGSSSNDLLRRQVTALSLQLQNNRCEGCSAGQRVAAAVTESDLRSNTSSVSLQDCTEMEYLRNILYKYMLGKEPLVLAKVLCALMKFDEDQTKEVVLKEEQKITLLGQLGIL